MKFSEALEKLNLGCTVALGSTEYRVIKEVLCQRDIEAKEEDWLPYGFTKEELASSEWRVIDYEPISNSEVVDFVTAMNYIYKDDEMQGCRYARCLATNRIYGVAVLNNGHTYLVGYNPYMENFEPIDVRAREVIGKWEIIYGVITIEKLTSTPIHYAPIDKLEAGLLVNNQEKHDRFIQAISID